MHPCLDLPEIADLICFNLCDVWKEYYWGADSKTLIALAQTCRHFYESAMSALWKDLRSLRPIIQCMGSEVYRINKKTLHLKIVRPLYPSDITVLNKYAHRIRTLRLDETEESDRISPLAFPVLHLLSDGQPLLPNLREVELWLNNELGSLTNTLPILNAILGHNLRSITVHHAPPSSRHGIIAASFIASLGIRYPGLTTVDIEELKPDEAAISGAILHWKHLAKLHVHKIDAAALGHLASLATLRDLSINIAPVYEVSTNHEELVLTKCSRGSFPSLRSLYVGSSDFSHCINFLLFLPPNARLDSLTISVVNNSFPTTDTLTKLIHAITSRVATTLGDLRICDFGENEPEEAMPTPAWLFEPLKKFIKLHFLQLDINRYVDITDDTVEALFSAWPDLSRVSVNNQGSIMRGRVFTLRGVASIARVCPRLQRMTLAFDARILPNFSRPISKALRSIFVRGSPIDNVSHVAAQISVIFPNADGVVPDVDIDRYDDDDDEEEEVSEEVCKWRLVRDILHDLRYR